MAAAIDLWVLRRLLESRQLTPGAVGALRAVLAGNVVAAPVAAKWGNTSFVEIFEGNRWRFKVHKLVTLADLCWLFKEYCTATEIYHWYCHAYKAITKRAHPKGSPDRQAAAKLRKRETGYYGFRRR